MRIKNFIITCAVAACTCMQLQAQNLFTYGKYNVSKDDFLKAYNKNPDTTGSRADKLKEYLDMYINFRLKLQAAYDEKLNTDESLKAEADNFKNQLTENFINEQANLTSLIKEAFNRSQKDILLSQIFIPSKKGEDSTAAWQQINDALAALKSNSFETVADKYNTDASLKASHGVTGYITVFTLPYTAENMLYSLPVGGSSSVYRSGAGYHIFQNKTERPAAGRRKIQQLLFSTPSFFTAEQIDAKRKLADSVYNAIQAGKSFSAFSAEYGNDTNPYDGSSNLEISVGDYAPDFEQQVYALQKPDEYCRPFQTAYGFNILKLMEVIPVSHDINDVINYAYLQEKVQTDGRLNTAKNKLVQKWYTNANFKENTYSKNDLWAYTDSALEAGDERAPAPYKSIKSSTVLFEFTKEKITVDDWLKYVKYAQETSETPVQEQYEKLMPVFKDASLNTYYRTHIDDFNPAITSQMLEFNDANMLFAVMDRHVWSKASEDTVGLKNYYDQHKEKYMWARGASAVVVSGPDKKTVQEIAAKMKAGPAADWGKIAGDYGSEYIVDSSRFEEGQFPTKQQVQMVPGFQTIPEATDAGDAFSFVQVLSVYTQPSQRNFDEARGMVINDYQQQLEEKWLKDLKAKYPVKINDAVLKGL